MFAPEAKYDKNVVVYDTPFEQHQNELAEEPDENMASHLTQCTEVQHNIPPSPIIANTPGPSGWKPDGHLYPILEISDNEHSEAGDAASFSYRREKRHLNHRAALQFIDSMAAVEGASNWDLDEEEEEANSTASDESFIVGVDIFD